VGAADVFAGAGAIPAAELPAFLASVAEDEHEGDAGEQRRADDAAYYCERRLRDGERGALGLVDLSAGLVLGSG
jgi:hypothetical protein